MDLISPTLTQLSNLLATYNKEHKIKPTSPWYIDNLELTLTQLSQSWQQADFRQARDTIEKFLARLDHNPDPEIQHFVHLTTGAHYCETGELDKAYSSFESALDHLQLAQEKNVSTSQHLIKDDSKRSILSLKKAWCHILGNKVDLAREILAERAEYPTAQLQGHRYVLLAIIGCIEADEALAEDYLLNAAEIYQAQEDYAALAAIRFYQAEVYQIAGAPQECLRHLKQSLQWLEENNYSYLPYWWHPQIIPSLLKKAIEMGCYPKQAKRMLRHYQKASAKFNTRFSQLVDEPNQGKLSPQTQIFTELLYRGDVGIHASEKCRRAMNELFHLIETGFLNEQMLPHLARKIPHGIKGSELNPTILAVFCLHVQNISVSEIATRLSLAVSTVKSYITKIYNAFELSIKNFSRRADRHTLLIEKAISEGYLM